MKKHIRNRHAHLFWIVLIIAAPLFGACQKEEENMPDEIRALEDAYRVIIGEWEWEKTEIISRGVATTVYETPKTENRTIHYLFKKNGTAIKNESDSQPINYKFEITSPQEGAFYLKLHPLDEDMKTNNSILILYDRNSLILSNGLGTSNYYTKIK